MGVLPDTKTTKGRIIHSLAIESPLKVKEIHQKLRREFHEEMSYQAVHKTIKDLEAEGVIKHDRDGYELSPAWVEKLASFSKELKESITKGKFRKLATKGSNEQETLVFDSVIDLGRWLIFDFMQREHDSQKTPVFHWQYAYYITGISKSELSSAEKALKNCNPLVMVNHNSILDRLLAFAAQGMGVKIKLGAKLPCVDFDQWVWGDYIAQIHYSKEINDSWRDKSLKFKSIEGIDLLAMFHVIHKKTDPIIVNVFRNHLLAEKYRREAKLLFGLN